LFLNERAAAWKGNSGGPQDHTCGKVVERATEMGRQRRGLQEPIEW